MKKIFFNLRSLKKGKLIKTVIFLGVILAFPNIYALENNENGNNKRNTSTFYSEITSVLKERCSDFGKWIEEKPLNALAWTAFLLSGLTLFGSKYFTDDDLKKKYNIENKIVDLTKLAVEKTFNFFKNLKEGIFKSFEGAIDSTVKGSNGDNESGDNSN